MNNENVKTTILDDGLKIVTQKADFNNVFVGAFVKVGLINESDEENGLSHFLEHMLFKGTQTKNALELSEYIEKLGGECNAYTSLESTVIHTSLLPEYWRNGVDFLSDVIQNSIFPEEEIERERKVIIQEIAMYENDADSEVSREFMSNVYKNDPFGREIIGTRENVSRFTRKDLIDYFNKWYVANNIVISACGNIDHDEFVQYVKEKFISGFRISKLDGPKTNTFKPIEVRKQNIFNQSHIMLGIEGLSMYDEEKDKMLFSILETIIDGGMSCRLFQEIRERHGLAYQVGLFNYFNSNSGIYGVHASLDEENIEEAVLLIKKVLASVKTDITEEELQKAKNTLLYGLSSRYDSCYRLATLNANCALFGVPNIPYEELKERFQAVTREEVLEFAQKIIPDVNENKYALAVMTPYGENEKND